MGSLLAQSDGSETTAAAAEVLDIRLTAKQQFDQAIPLTAVVRH